MNVEVKIRFKTDRPLTQEEAMRMWQIGSHFGAISASTYQLTTVAVKSNPLDAAQLLMSGIPTLTDAAVTIVGLTADATDQGRALPPRSKRSNREARSARASRPQTV